jgi:hypothetical protein
MKTVVLRLLFLGITFYVGNAQRSYSPYPIIFIHGMDQNDKIFYDVFSAVSPIYGDHIRTTGDDIGSVVHANLNRYRDMTNVFGNDNVAGTADDDVYVNPIQPISTGLYTINFETSWNEVASNPKLIPYADLWIVARESQSDQAALVKHGYVLQQAIKHVLEATGASKVILVGYSMGGVSIREYLQRREDGKPRWWVDPQAVDGHRVAKVVTMSSPHRGCDAMKWIPGIRDDADEAQASPLILNSSSEAVRDLRITYASGSQQQGVYLFGGYEGGLNTNWLFSGWHNGDVDCNGRSNDTVVGLNEGALSSLPLPTNVPFTYVTSKLGSLSGDFVVDTDRQILPSKEGELLPKGLSDTLFTDRAHWDVPSDAQTIMRGLDEPGTREFAYQVGLGTAYRGALTIQSGGGTSDTDAFVVNLADLGNVSGGLRFRLLDSTAPVRELSLSFTDSNGEKLKEVVVGATSAVSIDVDPSVVARAGEMLYFTISGTATAISWKHPYEFLIERIEKPRLAPMISGLVDTVIADQDTLMDSFVVNYDALEDLTWTVTSSDTIVLSNADLRIVGNGAHFVLQAVPQNDDLGSTVIRVECSDSVFRASREFRIRVIEEEVTGVNEDISTKADVIAISPLPAAGDFVTITSTVPDVLIHSVEVLNGVGNRVGSSIHHEYSLPSTSIAISTAGLPASYYLARVVTSIGTYVKALVVLR